MGFTPDASDVVRPGREFGDYSGPAESSEVRPVRIALAAPVSIPFAIASAAPPIRERSEG
jgi:hypothetical protein